MEKKFDENFLNIAFGFNFDKSARYLAVKYEDKVNDIYHTCGMTLRNNYTYDEFVSELDDMKSSICKKIEREYIIG